jgi:lycopene cyclase domain-containing protein
MISQRTSDVKIEKIKHLRKWLYLLIIPGFVLFFKGFEYTGLVFIFITIAVFVDQVLRTDLIAQKRFYLYLAIIIGFTIIFNGFLTWRPVVLYGEEFQMGFRVITIPIEDFGYGISLLFLNTSIFEKLNHLKSVNLKTA